jgi:hypothetical protein
MSAVKCSVAGCDRKLQPIWKVDLRDRDTWLYRECDECLRPVCEEHSRADEDGHVVCDECHEAVVPRQPLELIQLDPLRGAGP